MAFFIRKTINFIFHARTITRPYPFNFPGKHRATVKTTADNIVGLAIGMCDPARHLFRVHAGFSHKAKYRHSGCHASRHTITWLRCALAKVYGAAV